VFRIPKCVHICVGLWCVCALVAPLPVRAEDPPLSPSEEREIWGNLEELVIVRQERDALRQALAKSVSADQVKAVEIEKLTAMDDLNERIIAQHERLDAVRVKEIDAYKRIAAAEQQNAERAEAKAERIEKVSLVLTILGAIAFAAVSIFAK
jgi:hypothetical protein